MAQTIDRDLLLHSPVGQDLDEQEFAVLAGLMDRVDLAAGEDLVREGDEVSKLFILGSGKINVIGQVNGKEVVLYSMKPGECAGTRSFVERTPRKVTLRAALDSVVWTLEPDAFEALLEPHPRIVYRVMRGLFRQTHANLMRVDADFAQLSNYINKTGGRY